MKRSAAWIVLLLSLPVSARDLAADASVLPSSEYRLPPEEVIAIGHVPYWRQQESPQWQKPEMELEQPASRLQWAPRYSRDEREDYKGVRDQLNPQPRAKVFEVHF
ncbi:MAG TPA: hypothetical protein VLC91_15875 [Spongiibacteraceae bacterium]|nr:hypothetical protein [Spongiibacteraceae bacterium]